MIFCLAQLPDRGVWELLFYVLQKYTVDRPGG